MKTWIVIVAIAVACFSATVLISQAATPLTFEWDANTEPNLVGYKLYCKTAVAPTYKATPPFVLIATTAATEATVNLDLAIDAQNCAVTAYNDYGLESAYSNVVVSYPFVPPVAPRNFAKK